MADTVFQVPSVAVLLTFGGGVACRCVVQRDARQNGSAGNGTRHRVRGGGSGRGWRKVWTERRSKQEINQAVSQTHRSLLKDIKGI